MNRRSFIFKIICTILGLYSSRLLAEEGQKPEKNIKKTGYSSDPVFLKHHIAPGHPETPDRIKFIDSAMKGSGLLDELEKITIRKDVLKWIKTVHSENHINTIQETIPETYEVATAAVGAALAAVDDVVNGKNRNAFCAIRPPGHHALNTGREEGFCYFNNIAIAARYAQLQYGFKKILIVDWDYHHGNSTEAVFYADPSVLFFSTHDFYAYPGTGDPARQGEGKGKGYNINIHLPCGTDDKTIINAFETVLMPAAESFKPDFVLVSAGFDSREDDLLGCYKVTDDGFAMLTKMVMRIAEQHCGGKLVSMLEGGYNLAGNAKAVVTHVKTLMKNT